MLFFKDKRFLSIATLAIVAMSSTYSLAIDAGSETILKMEDSYPTGMENGNNDDIYFCARTADGVLSVYNYVAGSSPKLIHKIEKSAPCQFIKNEDGIFYAQTTKIDDVHKKLVIEKINEGTQKSETLAVYESSLKIETLGPVGSFDIKGNLIIAPLTEVESETSRIPYLLTSTDLGKNWTKLKVVIENKDIKKFLSIKIESDNSWLASGKFVDGEAFVLRSQDLGAHWKILFSQKANEIEVFTSQADGLMLGLLRIDDQGLERSELLLSKDGGGTWVSKKIPQLKEGQSHQVWDLAYDSALKAIAVTGAQKDGTQIYATYATTDLGENWVTIDNFRGAEIAEPFADAHAVIIDGSGYIFTLGHGKEEGGGATLVRRSLSPF